MPRYHKIGKIPHKRHTTFRKEDGNIHYEELFGTIGFDGMSSLLYHVHRPTQVKQIKTAYSVAHGRTLADPQAPLFGYLYFSFVS